MAKRIERHVRATASDLLHRIDNVGDLRRIDGRRGADRSRQRERLVRNVDRDDVRTDRMRDHDRRQTHASAAVHGDPLAGRRAALVDNRGRPLGTVLVARDVSAVNAQHRELAEQLRTIDLLRHDLAEQANRDPLTELHNRRFLMERFGPMLSRSGPATPVSVLMIDIDRFKRINDRYGHQVGDGVLVVVARRLTAAVPPGALVARWGGEEFVVVLPGAGVGDAIRVADRVRDRCEAEPFDVGHDAQRCTVSVGVSSFPADGLTVVDLLEASDRALYLAKRDGRNQVRSAGPELTGAPGATSRTAPSGG